MSPHTTTRAYPLLFLTVAWLGTDAAAQSVFTEWNFNGAGLSATSPAAALANAGNAAALMVGGTTPGSTGAFPADDGASDAGTGSAWLIGTFPAQGTASGTAGVEFRTVSTGFSAITFECDLKPQVRFSDYISVQFSLDAGQTWTPFLAAPYQLPGNTAETAFVWTNNLGGGGGGGVTFSFPPSANDHNDVRVRIVTVFDPALGSAYSPNSPTNAAGAPLPYIGSSAVRFDMVQFKGVAIQPQPPTIAAEASGISPGSLCVGVESPVSIEVAVVPGSAPASSSFTVIADASAIGASSAATMTPIGLDTSGRHRFILPAIIPGTLPAGTRTIAVAATDNVGRVAAASLSLVVATCCPADLDNDGTLDNGGSPDGGVDINDLLYFLNGFEAGSAGVDLDNDGNPQAGVPDGGVDINDLLFFLARFEAGC